MDLGPGELIIVLAIVVILFGPGRVAKLGGELGTALHDFREGLRSGGEHPPENEEEDTAQNR